MPETKVKEAIAAAEAAIAQKNVGLALVIRGEISRGVAYHPHLDPLYWRIYDRITALGRELATQRFIAAGQ